MCIFVTHCSYCEFENSIVVFDREQRSKVLKEAFVVVVVKNVLGNKKCASVAYYGFVVFTLYGLMWPYVTLYGLVVAFHDHGHVWPH